MKKVLFLLCAFCMLAGAMAQRNIYSFTVKDQNGKDVNLSEYKGKVILIINSATQCGFTYQYSDLQGMYNKFKDEGFVILDFPCNQFGEQAPGSNQEIHTFCTSNYDVTFPQFDKIDVNGENASPLFTWLKNKKGFEGFDMDDRYGLGPKMHAMLLKQDPNYAEKPDIKWNFTKFLIDKKGNVVKRFEPTADMEEVIQEAYKLLQDK
jgi:glutathione peroxidase